MKNDSPSSTKPYLIRAFYEWIIDNNCTPYIVLNTKIPEVDVPPQLIQDDKITLNISPQSIRDLQINNDNLYFRARFSGVEQWIHSPIQATLAIYAAENGEGIAFEEEEDAIPAEIKDISPTKKKKDKSKRHLSVVE